MIRQINERLAVWVVDHVGTMGCAWLFAVIAIIALPEAWGETFANGFHPLLLVTWLSQSFLQLVLLSIIMVGQDVKMKKVQDHAVDLHSVIYTSMANHHVEIHRKLDAVLNR